MLDSLGRRPRGKKLARMLGKPVRASLSVQWDPGDRDLLVVPNGDGGPVSARLHERLRPADLDAMRASLRPDEDAALARAAGLRERRQLELALCVEHVPGARDRTGLSALEPPGDVHAMARGPLTRGGAYFYADALVECLAAGGGNPDAATRALDFGASSGRLVRALQAAYPGVEWHACDPIESAIEWGREHLPGIAWLRNDHAPPLPYPDAHFDAVFALSVWSHFGEAAALRWFAEMHRIVRRGGHLVVTTHGLVAVRRLAAAGWHAASIDRAAVELFRSGFSFHDAFGEDEDWGNRGAEWGHALMSPEWMQAKLLPHWAVVEFRPGYVDAFQDVVVLERRGA